MSDPSPLRSEVLTWTALLGRWIEFAQASIALPDDDRESANWKASVAPIINLQAVTFALGDLEHLPESEHALARDKAAILIERSESELLAIWNTGDNEALAATFGEILPEQIDEMLDEALRALERAGWINGRVAIWPGPGVLTMPEVDLGDRPRAGTVLLAAPGTLIMPNEPVACWVRRPDLTIDGCDIHAMNDPVQLYRVFADDGTHFTHDEVESLLNESALADGDDEDDDDDVDQVDAPRQRVPLLIPLCADGEKIGEFPIERNAWIELQRNMMDADRLPVFTVK